MTLLWLAMTGCVGQQADTEVVCGEPGERRVAVVTELTFARRDDGVGVGFDLDQHVSDAGDDEGCYHEDLVSPCGLDGVDSSFSSMVPALEQTEAVAVEGLIQDYITNGDLLILLEMSRLDDEDQDACVDLGVWRGAGTPMVGTDGTILDSQTFEISSELEPAHLPGLELRDGSVEGGPFAMHLPIQILDVELDFNMQEAFIHIDWREDGTASGYFGGAVPIEEILVIVAEEDLGDIRDLVTDLVLFAADLWPNDDGECEALSVVFEFEAKKAFLYEE